MSPCIDSEVAILRHLARRSFMTHDGYSLVTNASRADCELRALVPSNRLHSWQATGRIKLRSVYSTAAPSDNSFLRAVDATDASLRRPELQSVGATDARWEQTFRPFGRCHRGVSCCTRFHDRRFKKPVD